METKREKIVISILIGMTILLWFIQQYLTNQLYYETPQYVKNQQKIEELKRANNILNQTDLKLRSYTFIDSQAQKRGFIPETFITP